MVNTRKTEVQDLLRVDFERLGIQYYRSKRLFMISEDCAGRLYELLVLYRFDLDYPTLVDHMAEMRPEIAITPCMLRKYCPKETLLKKACSEVCQSLQEKGEDVLDDSSLAFLLQYAKEAPLFTLDLIPMTKQRNSKSIALKPLGSSYSIKEASRSTLTDHYFLVFCIDLAIKHIALIPKNNNLDYYTLFLNVFVDHPEVNEYKRKQETENKRLPGSIVFCSKGCECLDHETVEMFAHQGVTLKLLPFDHRNDRYLTSKTIQKFLSLRNSKLMNLKDSSRHKKEAEAFEADFDVDVRT